MIKKQIKLDKKNLLRIQDICKIFEEVHLICIKSDIENKEKIDLIDNLYIEFGNKHGL